MTDFNELIKVTDSISNKDLESIANRAIVLAQNNFPETFKKLGE